MNKYSLLIILTVCTFSLFGCKSHEIITEVPVEVPVVHTEYSNKIDSVFVHDSIYQLIETKNDTVFNTKTIYKYKYKQLTDTILTVDTISKPVYITKTVTKEVEKPLKWYQTSMIGFGTVCLFMLIFSFGVKMIARYFKNKGMCL